jgi:inhibitor of cysteine peptidase
MRSKFVSIIIAAIVIILTVALWTLLRNDSGPENSEVANLLLSLKTQSEIPFQEISDSQIRWIVKRKEGMAEIYIVGKGFFAENVSQSQIISTEAFLRSEDFEADIYNTSQGSETSIVGYRRENIACLVKTYIRASDPGKFDLEIGCGKSTQSIESFIVTEEALKMLFVRKYGTSIEQITLNVSKETQNHIRGSVQFGSPGEPGGLFLATKVEDKWRLVFDGNGAISCEKVNKYGFPPDMVSDCAAINTIQTTVNSIFEIRLASNPTTGYQWQVNFDPNQLELVDREFIPHDEALIGSGGTDKSTFKALKSSEAQIDLYYLRPWEEGVPPLEEEVYKIIIQ